MTFNEEEYAISSDLENITERLVVYLDQENTHGESWNYYCNGQIVRAAVYKNRISGTVRELYDEYYIQITADEHEITSSCSCGSRDQVCKHVISLLYSWVNDRDGFLDVGKVIKQLYSMEKADLVSVIERILQTDPSTARFVKPPDEEFEDFLEDGF